MEQTRKRPLKKISLNIINRFTPLFIEILVKSTKQIIRQTTYRSEFKTIQVGNSRTSPLPKWITSKVCVSPANLIIIASSL